jgi:GAF domain-containing protein
VLRSEFTGLLDLRAQFNLTLTDAQREAITRGEGFLEVCLRNAQGLLTPQFFEHEHFSQCARLGFETASLLLAPIILSEQVLGLIALGGREPKQFGLNTLNLARGIARQAAQAILNTRHREEDEARARRSRQVARA